VRSPWRPEGEVSASGRVYRPAELCALRPSEFRVRTYVSMPTLYTRRIERERAPAAGEPKRAHTHSLISCKGCKFLNATPLSVHTLTHTHRGAIAHLPRHPPSAACVHTWAYRRSNNLACPFTRERGCFLLSSSEFSFFHGTLPCEARARR